MDDKQRKKHIEEGRDVGEWKEQRERERVKKLERGRKRWEE